MTRSGEHLPRGFLGPVRAWGGLVPAASSVLQLPRQRSCLAGGLPPGGFDLVEVQALTESMGRVEDVLPRLAAALAAEGTLLLDVDNVQSPRVLRLCLEGRPGPFDPAGSTDDPSQCLPLRRVLAAAAAADLWIHDVLRVPANPGEPGARMAQDLFAHGLLPLDWLGGAPPARFWVVARKQAPLAGSVLVAGGEVAARQQTVAVLRSFLPADWEVVVGEAPRECAQWNRALAAARGELVWFLRGGSLPTEAAFAALASLAGVGAVAPGANGRRRCEGDVAGLMLPRLDVLLVGPLPEEVDNTPVALEEYGMRLDSKLPPVQLVDVDCGVPSVAAEAPETFSVETQALLERWSAVNGRPAASPSVEPPAIMAASVPWRGRDPRISLCMITRDEQRFLGECLRRAQPAVDEIVVVDTGSTDDTIAIAESFGARVLREEWQDDFSAPRNTGLRVATGDWILVLDADEFLQPGACERIRELVRRETVSGYHLRFRNVYGQGKTMGVMMVRLFRNLPGIAYQNVIHEQVTPSLQRISAELGLVLACADVEVEHHGYTDELMQQRGKNERNERLFRKQLAKCPEDVYGHYKYGDFLRRLPGRSADARALLDRCLELILAGPPSLPRELPYAGEVAALCALEAARAGDSDRAREVIDLGLRRFLPTPNLHYLAASLALAEGRASDAILHFRRCLSYRGQTLVVPIQDGITGHVSLTGIAQAWILRGDVARAQRLLEQAIAIEPGYEVASLALSKCWLQRGDPARAIGVLTGFLAAHPESPAVCQQLTLVLHRLGHTAEARRMGEHAVRLLEARALDHEAAAMQRTLAAM